MFYIWHRSRAKQEELFWTGIVWTSVQKFGKLYSFHDALKIMNKRFSRKYPMKNSRPSIKQESYFVERERMKRKGKFNTVKEKGESNV